MKGQSTVETIVDDTPKTCPDCGSQDVSAMDNGKRCELCGARWGMTGPTPEATTYDKSAPWPEPGPVVPELAVPKVTGWWALSSVELARALRRVAEGETPEAVYFSLVENAEVPGP